MTRPGKIPGPAELIAAMKKTQSQSTSNPCSISQVAAEAALNGDQGCITPMLKAFKERHDFVVKRLNAMKGVKCIESDGTFYTFADVRDVIASSNEFSNDVEMAEFLLEVQRFDKIGHRERTMGKARSLGKIAEQERALNETLEKGVRGGGHAKRRNR